jgi:hypothetical protein
MKPAGSRVKNFVYLLEEGTDAQRPTEMVYSKFIQHQTYDPEDEVWEFPPGSIARCETTSR